MSIELRPARTLSPSERTPLFNRSYEGYVVPFVLSEELLAFMDETYDIDLDASRIAYRDGEPVGLGNLGVRGENGWIGGVGVVASARRQGIGELLMRELHEQARARGVREVWLEVIEQNTQAFALYEKLGYRVVRDVEVLSLTGELEPADAHEVSVGEALGLLPDEHEPWQRANESVAHLADAQAIATGDGAAIFREADGRVSVLRLHGEDAVHALRSRGPVSVLNWPAEDDTFRRLGATSIVRQREMLLEFC